MVISNGKVIEIVKGMDSISNKSLPIKISWVIGKNYKKLQDIYKEYELARNKIIAKYARKSDDGQIQQNENGGIILDDVAGFSVELNDLNRCENDIPIDLIKLEDILVLDEGKFDSLTPAEISVMEFMIEDRGE